MADEKVIDLGRLERFYDNLKSNGLPLNNWQANKKYKIGYTVIQDGKFYRCKIEHTSTTTFDNTKWTNLSIGYEKENLYTGTTFNTSTLTVTTSNSMLTKDFLIVKIAYSVDGTIVLMNKTFALVPVIGEAQDFSYQESTTDYIVVTGEITNATTFVFNFLEAYTIDNFKVVSIDGITLGSYSGGSTGTPIDYILRLRADSSGITDLADNTWNNNNVTNAGIGKFGSNSLSFSNASDSYLSKSAAFEFSKYEDFTVSFWAYAFSNVNAFAVLISGKFSVSPQYYDGSNYSTLVFVVNNQNTDEYYRYMPLTTLSLNSWHHYAVTRSDGIVRVFLDGVMVDADNFYHSVGDSSSTLYIGGSGTTGRSFDGYLDDVCIIRGRALWTGNFTAPTDYLPDSL